MSRIPFFSSDASEHLARLDGFRPIAAGLAYGSPVGATLVGSNWVVPPGFQVAPRGTRTVSAVRPVDSPVRSSMRLGSMPFSVVR